MASNSSAGGNDGPVTIRWASAADAARLRRLAALDSQPAPRGAVLLAEIEGDLWAAVSEDGLRRVADPFRHSAALVELLVARSHQLARGLEQAAPCRHWRPPVRRRTLAA